MGRAFDLLIVDDDPAQITLMRALLAELKLPHRCHHAAHGSAALHFLHRDPPFQSVPRPDLILLDINMPGMNGCEILHEIKSDPDLHSIPVMVLSNSLAAKDVNACYAEHANAYLHKEADLDSNLDLVRLIDRFWARTAVLPRKNK